MITSLSSFPSFSIDFSSTEINRVTCYVKYFFSTNRAFFLSPKSSLFPFQLPSLAVDKKNGYMGVLLLFGLNYSAKRLKYYRTPFMLDLHKSHRIIIAEPRCSSIASRIFKRRILFFSYSSQDIKALVNKIQKYQAVDPYSAHGPIALGDRVKRKPGKVRQKR